MFFVCVELSPYLKSMTLSIDTSSGLSCNWDMIPGKKYLISERCQKPRFSLTPQNRGLKQ